jgi:hypothetical protein
MSSGVSKWLTRLKEEAYLHHSKFPFLTKK